MTIKKMLAGQITGPRSLEMVEIQMPEVGEGQMLIKLSAGSICGSDLPYFLLDTAHPALAGASAPLPPMLSLHELVGTVAQSRSRSFKEGDRVLALPHTNHRGLAEYFLSTPNLAIALPQGRADLLVVSQPLGTVIHACLKLPNLLGQTAVVIGQGPIGLLFTACLWRMGAVRVIAVDLLPERLKVSRRMGATETVCGGEREVVEAVKAYTNGEGVDLAIEAVGVAETLNLAASLIKRNGTLLAFGVPHAHRCDFAFHNFFHKEGRLITSVGPDVQKDFPLAVEMITTGVIDVTPLITHRIPLTKAQEGFKLFADRTEGVIKVVLTTEDQ